MSKMIWLGHEIEEAMEEIVEEASLQTVLVAKMYMKERVHRVTGTLSRSIHVAPTDYEGSTDQAIATASEVIDVPYGDWDVAGRYYGIAVGSWIEYADDEELRGGSHENMGPSFEMAVQEYPTFLEQAFRRRTP